MKKFLIVLFVLVLMLAAGVGVFLYRGFHIDENIVFMPVQRPDRVELSIRGEDTLINMTHERIDLGGETIAVTTVGLDTGPLIISCFGNASDRYEHGVDYIAKIAPYGQVLLWDYPGYGDSSGAATVDAVARVTAALVPLIEARAAGRPILYWGHSLGGFVCSNLAAQTDHVAGLVLETTAPSIRSVAAAWTPDSIPLRVTFDEDLLRYDIPAALANVTAPILIIGAGRDRVLPVALSRELAEALPQAAYLEIPLATHFSAGFDPYTREAVRDLLNRL
ncbi:alpha/beta hydrolase [Algimonas arctica]|uniref:Alpha/beta hydrolase n=1 Tax=Algimonas arctica TaxID=1479486 RepID=A0A8J3CRJ6_9PROT|nr:alpha/beta fold hydrolase [Algimonas arctica]GHA98719.1 alpha/beta hydrolase [Algimonas arctica]